MHVPKTAGSSLILDAKRVLGPMQILEMGPNFARYRSGTRRELELSFIGHASGLDAYMTIERYKTQRPQCVAVGVCRNPYDRLVSAFHYLARWGDAVERERFVGRSRGDFRRFVRLELGLQGQESPSAFDNNVFCRQVTWLCDSDGRLRVDLLGRYESLAASYVAIGTLLGVPFNQQAHVNRSRHAPWTTYYDSQLRALVYNAYREDFEVLGYER